MVVKIYMSGISGNKEVKKKQQRVQMILDSKSISYEAIDITEPGREKDKETMQQKSKVRETLGKHPLPPQLFNEEEYCGDYEDFDLANEVDQLEAFLHLPLPSKFSSVDSSSPDQVNGSRETTDAIKNGDDRTLITNGDVELSPLSDASPGSVDPQTDELQEEEPKAEEGGEVEQEDTKEDTDVNNDNAVEEIHNEPQTEETAEITEESGEAATEAAAEDEVADQIIEEVTPEGTRVEDDEKCDSNVLVPIAREIDVNQNILEKIISNDSVLEVVGIVENSLIRDLQTKEEIFEAQPIVAENISASSEQLDFAKTSARSEGEGKSEETFHSHTNLTSVNKNETSFAIPEGDNVLSSPTSVPGILQKDLPRESEPKNQELTSAGVYIETQTKAVPLNPEEGSVNKKEVSPEKSSENQDPENKSQNKPTVLISGKKIENQEPVVSSNPETTIKPQNEPTVLIPGKNIENQEPVVSSNPETISKPQNEPSVLIPGKNIENQEPVVSSNPKTISKPQNEPTVLIPGKNIENQEPVISSNPETISKPQNEPSVLIPGKNIENQEPVVSSNPETSTNPQNEPSVIIPEKDIESSNPENTTKNQEPVVSSNPKTINKPQNEPTVLIPGKNIENQEPVVSFNDNQNESTVSLTPEKSYQSLKEPVVSSEEDIQLPAIENKKPIFQKESSFESEQKSDLTGSSALIETEKQQVESLNNEKGSPNQVGTEISTDSSHTLGKKQVILREGQDKIAVERSNKERIKDTKEDCCDAQLEPIVSYKIDEVSLAVEGATATTTDREKETELKSDFPGEESDEVRPLKRRDTLKQIKRPSLPLTRSPALQEIISTKSNDSEMPSRVGGIAIKDVGGEPDAESPAPPPQEVAHDGVPTRELMTDMYKPFNVDNISFSPQLVAHHQNQRNTPNREERGVSLRNWDRRPSEIDVVKQVRFLVDERDTDLAICRARARAGVHQLRNPHKRFLEQMSKLITDIEAVEEIVDYQVVHPLPPPRAPTPPPPIDPFIQEVLNALNAPWPPLGSQPENVFLKQVKDLVNAEQLTQTVYFTKERGPVADTDFVEKVREILDEKEQSLGIVPEPKAPDHSEFLGDVLLLLSDEPIVTDQESSQESLEIVPRPSAMPKKAPVAEDKKPTQGEEFFSAQTIRYKQPLLQDSVEAEEAAEEQTEEE